MSSQSIDWLLSLSASEFVQRQVDEKASKEESAIVLCRAERTVLKDTLARTKEAYVSALMQDCEEASIFDEEVRRVEARIASVDAQLSAHQQAAADLRAKPRRFRELVAHLEQMVLRQRRLCGNLVIACDRPMDSVALEDRLRSLRYYYIQSHIGDDDDPNDAYQWSRRVSPEVYLVSIHCLEAVKATNACLLSLKE
jgi:hypothetical protein